MFFISMYTVLNKLSEHNYFYISKNITSYTFSLVFKIVKSLQCILNRRKIKRGRRVSLIELNIWVTGVFCETIDLPWSFKNAIVIFLALSLLQKILTEFLICMFVIYICMFMFIMWIMHVMFWSCFFCYHYY